MFFQKSLDQFLFNRCIFLIFAWFNLIRSPKRLRINCHFVNSWKQLFRPILNSTRFFFCRFYKQFVCPCLHIPKQLLCSLQFFLFFWRLAVLNQLWDLLPFFKRNLFRRVWLWTKINVFQEPTSVFVGVHSETLNHSDNASICAQTRLFILLHLRYRPKLWV